MNEGDILLKEKKNGKKMICTLVDGETRWRRERGYWRAVTTKMCENKLTNMELKMRMEMMLKIGVVWSSIITFFHFTWVS